MNWTSVDQARYLHVVTRAVKDTGSFHEFRQNLDYCQILEHVTPVLGQKYLNLITDSLIRQICFNSEFADTVGGPKVYSYEGKSISPTTLRYGKVLNDLLIHFSSFRDMKSIIEIGVGYGGQARIISEYAKRTKASLESYTFIDLPAVLQLCHTYLQHFDFPVDCEYLEADAIAAQQSWDLVISNYAFSEFDRALQEYYLQKILLRARSGYLTMNTGLPQTLTSSANAHFSAKELLRILPNAEFIPELPNSGPDNYILLFGQR